MLNSVNGMKTSLMAAAMLGIIGSAAAAQGASGSQVASANKASNRCITEAVSNLDDGMSDPSLVAQAALTTCRESRVHYIRLATSQSVSNGAEDRAHEMHQADMRDVTALVLKRRAQRR